MARIKLDRSGRCDKHRKVSATRAQLYVESERVISGLPDKYKVLSSIPTTEKRKNCITKSTQLIEVEGRTVGSRG